MGNAMTKVWIPQIKMGRFTNNMTPMKEWMCLKKTL